MCLVGVVVRRYIHFLRLLIPTPLVSALFGSSIIIMLKTFIQMTVDDIMYYNYAYLYCRYTHAKQNGDL